MSQVELEGAVQQDSSKPGEVFFQDQMEKFKKLVEKNPQQAYAQYGWTLLYSADNPVAAEFREKMELTPATDAEEYDLAILAHTQGDLEKAEKGYLNALDAAPERYEIHYNLGVLYSDSGKKEKAIPELTTFLEEATEKAWKDEAQKLLESLEE